MINTENYSHHPAIQDLAEYVAIKTENSNNINFIKIMVAYQLSTLASSMRASVETKDRGIIPINTYCCALAPSGFGKGITAGFIANITEGFRTKFLEETFKDIAEVNLHELATKRAATQRRDFDEVLEEVEKEYKSTGAYYYSFSEGTAPALKQVRHKLLMAKVGAMNFEVDEIGMHLSDSTEILAVYLELYDKGLVKPKITKNTGDNARLEDVTGWTPANLMMFGVPSKLFDGGKTENLFYDLLDMGYARRTFFGFCGSISRDSHQYTPEEIFKMQTDTTKENMVAKWKALFTSLADVDNYNKKIIMPDDVSVELIRYKIACEKIADSLPEHKEIQKAETAHRYFKVLKLAGLYAFLDGSNKVTMENLHQAILFAEESAQSFKKILKREKPHVKLAKYIANAGTELTVADFKEQLPFYPNSIAQRNEIMTLACAWAYKNNIVLKNRFESSVELFWGEKLDSTDLDKVLISFSKDMADGYRPFEPKFEDLYKLTCSSGFHWCNHTFKAEHRSEQNTIPGFNLLVLDVDEGTTLEQAKTLFKDYTYLIHTTKRHTAEENRFRIILPMNYKLNLDQEEYKQFMRNISDWLPISVDSATFQRSRKWESFNGEHYYNYADLIDILPFIPNTSKNEQFKNESKAIQSLSALERWFAREMRDGNRNNTLIRYALSLVDSGMSYIDVESAVLAFNKKIESPLSKDEINSTVLRTVAKRYQ